ncbi:MAG TPA: hypothetical protein VFF19_09585 [Reyranella sp.]|jgi:hypothetical protein|nr:hypothetical protein [Reyranella sp.]
MSIGVEANDPSVRFAATSPAQLGRNELVEEQRLPVLLLLFRRAQHLPVPLQPGVVALPAARNPDVYRKSFIRLTPGAGDLLIGA